MTTLIKDKPKGRFISILADGKFHETVAKETEGAVEREYETSSGEKGTKWELVYPEIRGFIRKVDFWTGDFGDMVQLTFGDPGEEQITISQSVAGNFGEDILKKLPSISPEKEVWIRPYAFKDETSGKDKRGVTFYQNGDKVPDFFWDGKKKTNGFPEPEGDTAEYGTDDWKIYFLQARKFLVKYVKENVVPKFDAEIQYEPTTEYPSENSEEMKPPF